eukprot:384461-Hanusia_phi.AAC.2
MTPGGPRRHTAAGPDPWHGPGRKLVTLKATTSGRLAAEWADTDKATRPRRAATKSCAALQRLVLLRHNATLGNRRGKGRAP